MCLAAFTFLSNQLCQTVDMAASLTQLCILLIATSLFGTRNCWFWSNKEQKAEGKPPIIIVPGDGGSQLEAKLDKPSCVHWYCFKHSDWFSLWVDLEEMAPEVIDCTMDNMKLLYNRGTRTTSNNYGVDIRQPGFGKTYSIEYLDPDYIAHYLWWKLDYFYYLIEDLVSKGYERNVNIRGAPYDFRKGPNEMGEFYEKLKQLVEDTFEENNNQRVILLAHSMGNLHVLYMLNHQPQSWKDKYIRSFISIAGPWGGAVKTLRLMASGDSLGIFWVSPEKLKMVQRSMPSTAWMMPFSPFWTKTEVLVQTPTRNYTVADYKQFFKDVNYIDGYLMRLDTGPLLRNLKAPGVEVHCIHGSGVKTPGSYIYTNFNTDPTVVWEDGDGTVNLRSLQGCDKWHGKQNPPIIIKAFQKVNHMDILSNTDAINYIIKAVLH